MTHMSRDDLPALCKPGFTGRAWAPGPRRQLARASLRKQLTIQSTDCIDYYAAAPTALQQLSVPVGRVSQVHGYCSQSSTQSISVWLQVMPHHPFAQVVSYTACSAHNVSRLTAGVTVFGL